ncbi:unnamed protein product [Clonostachys rosea f. rosea IK726]|uniref:Uncharacterized protein n=1 Tax=Clonostachys rosea f. rosea IK726 TaxID=1349383 RepID=A0ACA9UJ29_BIOOC|nr:unnamed protein product [Clonostachys rosea f. rosea IK726]
MREPDAERGQRVLLDVLRQRCPAISAPQTLPVKTEELWGFCASNSHGPRHHITYSRYSSTKR